MKLLMSEVFGTWGETHVTSRLSGLISPKSKLMGAGTAIREKDQLNSEYSKKKKNKVNTESVVTTSQKVVFLKSDNKKLQ